MTVCMTYYSYIKLSLNAETFSSAICATVMKTEQQ